jgi:hypothetical protein
LSLAQDCAASSCASATTKAEEGVILSLIASAACEAISQSLLLAALILGAVSWTAFEQTSLASWEMCFWKN